jgi:hypothetical protein
VAEPPLTWYRSAPEALPSARRTWWRAPPRDRTIDALACLAVSALCFSQASSELLFRADWDFYNRPLGAPALAAFLVSIVGLAAVGVVGAQVMRRVRRLFVHRLGAVAAAAMAVVALNAARLTYESVGRWMDALGRPALLALVVLLLAAACRWPDRALRGLRGSALVASPLAVLTLAHALWMFLELAGGPCGAWSSRRR